MMGVEPAGQRTERGHDHLRRGNDEAAPGYLAPAQMDAQLGMVMARDLWLGIVANRLVAKNDSAKFDLILQLTAAVVGETGVMVADDR